MAPQRSRNDGRDAHEHLTELQNALDDSQRALDRLDSPGLEAACQRMHDAAGVDLQAHLPTPGPDLTTNWRQPLQTPIPLRICAYRSPQVR